MSYWEALNASSKRNILLWLYILRTEPIEQIVGSFLEPKWIDADQEIVAHRIPDYVLMLSPKQILSALNEVGGPPSWTQNKIQ
jgi:hypothetical protein